ncbi:MAG: phosphatase PAP2 family protein [Burkholderiales bacterium]
MTNSPLPWTTEIALRMRRHFLLKLFGTTAWIWVFFIAYFQLLRYPAYAVSVMPLTALDHLIPFQPWTLYAYLSLWLYVGVAPGLQLRFVELLVYGLWAGALCLTGLALFYFWPTAVPPVVLDVAGVPGFQILQGIDATGNACPSMHVAIAMFTVIWIEHLLRNARAPVGLRVVNVAWFLAITWSTLAIKQHVVLDVLAGALLGLAFALPSLRWRPGAARENALRLRADIIKT